MKKFCKLMTVILAMALFILTPGVTVLSSRLASFVSTAESSFQYATPAQSISPFKSNATAYDLSTWSKPNITDFLGAEQVTPESNAKFHEKYPNNSLTDGEIADRSPVVIFNKVLNQPVKGGYSTNEITLSANSYYLISVDYYVVEQTTKDIANIAYGTFYLNNKAISLYPQKGWDTATFYITTDKLATATVTPKLYFGSNQGDGYTIGAIYFDNFNVTAVSQNFYQTKLASRNKSTSEVFDFTHTNDIKLVAEFTNSDFEAKTTTTNADSNANISTAEIPSSLGFNESQFNGNQPYFHSKSGETKNIMLMKAHGANTSLKLKNYTFQPKPYEVYMFQFYSIANGAENNESFNGFHFLIGDVIAQEVTTISDYPHYNGWQLNTVFFIAGKELNQKHDLQFTLGKDESTGWVCIDEFKIYKVNGSYAEENTDNPYVHGVHDQNANNSTTPSITNGYFDLGRSADTVNNQDSSYPYPLIADGWTTNNDNNGIVNTDLTLWSDIRFGDNNPGKINANYLDNNNVYMMHNTATATNILTSPSINTTAGATTYISFDACSTGTALTRAYILTAETDESGNLTNEIILPKIIDINDGEWHHYEFAITENEFTVSRQYYLRFEMNGTKCFAFIDNVSTSQNPAAGQVTTANIDLNNTLTFDKAWKSTNELASYSCNATPTGTTLEIFNQPETIIQNNFGYSLTVDEYYEIIIEAHGNNAYLGLSNYDGLLEVITDEVDPTLTHEYKLYLQPKTDATNVNLQITLGNITETNENSIANGNIFIKNLKVKKITEEQFNLVSDSSDTDRIKILSVNEKDNSEDNTNISDTSTNLFGENWWYLVPSLITAVALLLGIIAFLMRKVKFDKHITKKTTSYARDMRLKNQQKKIVAQKAAKVDNVTDEKQSN